MVRFLRLKKHKALVLAQMEDLGVINIICGKNNSGKTTILECLCNKSSFGIGMEVDDVQLLENLFLPEATRYNDPDPTVSIDWFRDHLKNLANEKIIWFSDDRETIISELQDSQKSDRPLHRFRKDIFNFKKIVDEFFQKSEEGFDPILIPPKRQIEFGAEINLGQEVNPAGNGIINKLFFLKNQDLQSDEYETYKNIYEMFYEITGSRFNIVPNKDNRIILLYNSDENWISASDSGLGLSDVLIIVSILNLFPNNIFLIEEPENHLHAEYQKRLLAYLSTIKEKQFFISTHSPIFLDSGLADKIYYCENNGEIHLSDQTSKSEIISSLGYSVSENLVADVLILVEGPTDIPVIREMINWFGINSRFNIKYWALGGDIMASHDLTVFAERKNVFALVDNDPGSSALRTRFIRHCKEIGINCTRLKKYSIENYFPLQAIKTVFPDQIPSSIGEISPDSSVDDQIGFKSKKKSVKTKSAEIVRNMSVSDIEGTDLSEFLSKIQKYLEKEELRSVS